MVRKRKCKLGRRKDGKCRKRRLKYVTHGPFMRRPKNSGYY